MLRFITIAPSFFFYRFFASFLKISSIVFCREISRRWVNDNRIVLFGNLWEKYPFNKLCKCKYRHFNIHACMEYETQIAFTLISSTYKSLFKGMTFIHYKIQYNEDYALWIIKWTWHKVLFTLNGSNMIWGRCRRLYQWQRKTDFSDSVPKHAVCCRKAISGKHEFIDSNYRMLHPIIFINAIIKRSRYRFKKR